MGYRRNIHPVQSLKHIVDKQGGLLVNTQVVEDVVIAVDNPVFTNANNIKTSSTVNGIFLNIQVAATSTAALANIYMYVMKNPGNNVPSPLANVVGTTDERKFIIHQEMIMTEKNSTAFPRTLFKGVIKLPKHMKRFGIKDRLQIALLSPGTTYDYCIQCIYKEFS